MLGTANQQYQFFLEHSTNDKRISKPTKCQRQDTEGQVLVVNTNLVIVISRNFTNTNQRLQI